MPDSATGLAIDISGGHLVLVGDLDAHTAVQLSDALTPLPNESVIEVDLAGVEFMDSSGLRVILEARRDAAEHGREIVLTNPSRAVRRLFEITGLDDFLTADPS